MTQIIIFHDANHRPACFILVWQRYRERFQAYFNHQQEQGANKSVSGFLTRILSFSGKKVAIIDYKGLPIQIRAIEIILAVLCQWANKVQINVETYKFQYRGLVSSES